MVISCVAYGCTNRVGKGCDISFHRHVFMLKDKNRIDLKSDLNMLCLQTGITYSCHGLNIFKLDFHWRMKVYWQHGQKQYQGRTGHQENMITYAVNISNLNASMRSLEERVVDFSLMQFQVSTQAFHPTCNHLENLQGNHQWNVQLNIPPRT